MSTTNIRARNVYVHVYVRGVYARVYVNTCMTIYERHLHAHIRCAAQLRLYCFSFFFLCFFFFPVLRVCSRARSISHGI
jgi:hypothetical protein